MKFRIGKKNIEIFIIRDKEFESFDFHFAIYTVTFEKKNMFHPHKTITQERTT